MTAETRSEIWRGVWNDRDPGLVRMNGFESCFSSEAEYRAFVAQQARFIADTLRLDTRDRVADLGCGTGLISSILAPQVRSIAAFDFSHDALAVAREEHAAPNVTYRWADLGALDLDELQVDKAYSMAAIYYLDDYSTALRLVRGLLERGIEVLVSDVPDARLRHAVTRDYDTDRFSHLYFDEDQLRADLPGVAIHRGVFPTYPNDRFRFSFHIAP